MAVILRRPIEGDVGARAELGFHPEVLLGFGLKRDTSTPMTLEQAQTWVQRISSQTHAWIIEHQSKLLGEIRLDNLNADDSCASMAVAIVDHTKLGQGLGRESIKACLKIAFEDLNLHRVSIRVLASNKRAIRCYESCGFQVEGLEREAAMTDWGWESDMIMGILAQHST